jgi:hypothetical protein
VLLQEKAGKLREGRVYSFGGLPDDDDGDDGRLSEL